ncbi:hypothetical protein EOB77_19565 [Mesorhizobium sp. M7A.F.Ca.MR.228.00.0.0]|nr:hypothetical protein EOB77_19565 [Mesorhizobium sp. M7A.F.Ca.MR.228.00.0.0]
MEHQQTARILVAGTGPAGLIAALGFAAEGFPVTLVGPEPTAPDGRTTALMNPALKVLDRLGVLETVKSKAAPLKVMRIVDATSRLIRSPVVTFRASEIDEDQFGLNLPNSVLNPALASAVAAHAGIDRLMSMPHPKDGTRRSNEWDRAVASRFETHLARQMRSQIDGGSDRQNAA